MKSDKKVHALLRRHTKISRNLCMFCALIGFALVASVDWQTATLRLLLDAVLLISMGIFSSRLIQAQTQCNMRQDSEPVDAMCSPEQIGAVQPLGQMQSISQEHEAGKTCKTDETYETADTAGNNLLTVSQKELKRLHEKLVQAQQENGEGMLDFDSLQEIVTRTTKQIFAQHSCQGVAFEVIRHKGRVTLQPRILREPQSHQAPENSA